MFAPIFLTGLVGQAQLIDNSRVDKQGKSGELKRKVAPAKARDTLQVPFPDTVSYRSALSDTSSVHAGIATASKNLTSATHRPVSAPIPIVTLTAATTLGSIHNTILANTSNSGFTITLPSPSAVPGHIYTIKKIGTGGIDNALTIASAGSTIDGEPHYIIYNDYTFIVIQANGKNWNILKD